MKGCPLPEPKMTREEGIAFLKSIETLLRLDNSNPNDPQLKFITDDPEQYNKCEKAFIAVGCSSTLSERDGIATDGEGNLSILANIGIKYQGSSRFYNLGR